MENFISCTIKKRLSYLSCIIIVSAIVILNIIERFAPIAFDVFFILGIFYYAKEEFPTLYKYKIENNALIVKKLFKTQTYNFDELEKVLFPVPSKNDTFVFKFSQKSINIFYDKNTSKLIGYFYKNNIENIYEKKKDNFENTKCFINISNEPPLRYPKIKMLIGFIISLFCFIDVFFERPNEIIDYIFMATTVACTIFFIIAFFKSFKKVKVSDSENEYIDKNGFHLKDLFIPFCETEEIFKVIKKWGIIKLKIKTKKDEEYEIPTFGFYGDILYEMYLQKKIKA